MSVRRVLHAGEFSYGASGEGVAAGFRKLGWENHFVDIRDHFLASPALPLRLAARAMRPLLVRSYNDAILRAARQVEPHALLTVKGLNIEPATLRALGRMGVRSANYFPDFHFRHGGFDVNTFAQYDFVFTTKSFQLDALREQFGVREPHFLHHGYSSAVHYPRLAEVSEADFEVDCLYVGIGSPYKAKWLHALQRRAPNVSLKIVGANWRNLLRGTPLEPCYLGYPLFGDAYARAAQTARINLAFHSGPSEPQGWQDLVSTRTFEIPACRGFMLHIDNSETRSLFAPGEEIGAFASEDELVEKVIHYLARPEQRAQMIERAYARCVPAYSYDARAVVLSRALAGAG